MLSIWAIGTKKRVFDLGHWLARYCILKIEYIIVSYIIILRYGSIGGTSTFALRLMLLPPLPLPIWYAWLGDDILHPVIGFLHFWICLKAFMCAICSYFQTDLFHSGMAYFFYMVLYS